jgi:hypothetical protein
MRDAANFGGDAAGGAGGGGVPRGPLSRYMAPTIPPTNSIMPASAARPPMTPYAVLSWLLLPPPLVVDVVVVDVTGACVLVLVPVGVADADAPGEIDDVGLALGPADCDGAEDELAPVDWDGADDCDGAELALGPDDCDAGEVPLRLGATDWDGAEEALGADDCDGAELALGMDDCDGAEVVVIGAVCVVDGVGAAVTLGVLLGLLRHTPNVSHT